MSHAMTVDFLFTMECKEWHAVVQQLSDAMHHIQVHLNDLSYPLFDPRNSAIIVKMEPFYYANWEETS